jgi:hypothetical protein
VRVFRDPLDPLWRRGPSGYALKIRLYRFVPYVNGWGRNPGEVSTIDGAGRVLDSEQLDDVLSVRDVSWDRYDVRFRYDQHGKTYEGKLALGQ